MTCELAPQISTLNLAKMLLLALNEGRDELLGTTVVEQISPLSSGYLHYEEVIDRLEQVLAAMLQQPVGMTECIGLITVVESLSAIRYAQVTAHRSIEGITTAFTHKRSFPKYSASNPVISEIEAQLRSLLGRLSSYPLVITLSGRSDSAGNYCELYGQKTGATPNLRAAGDPLTTTDDVYTKRTT